MKAKEVTLKSADSKQEEIGKIIRINFRTSKTLKAADVTRYCTHGKYFH